MTKTRQRRLKRIETAKFVVWRHSKNITDRKESVRHMRAVYYLVNLAKRA